MEPFETNTVNVGDINGQNGWDAWPTNGALIQTNEVYAGKQALRLQAALAPVTCQHLFSGYGTNVVWVDLMTMVIPLSVKLTNRLEEAGGLYFDEDGRLVVYDGSPAVAGWVTDRK